MSTAQALLSTHASGRTWSVNVRSVFDLDPNKYGVYDVVYSWGVLHHTGDMWIAIRKASAMVAPGGYLALALYRRTPLCGFWRTEKKIYATSPRFIQAVIRTLYKAIYLCGLIATGRILLAISAITCQRVEWTGLMTFMIGLAAILINRFDHRN